MIKVANLNKTPTVVQQKTLKELWQKNTKYCTGRVKLWFILKSMSASFYGKQVCQLIYGNTYFGAEKYLLTSFMKGRRYFDKSMSKTTEKMINDQLRRIFKQDTAIWWELTAISALFLISSANSVLVSVTLFGAAILSCIFRLFGFPDVWPQGPMGKQPCSPSDSPRMELSKVHLLRFLPIKLASFSE